MKFIKIFIAKADVFKEVSLNTAYTGAKSATENGLFDRVATINADSPILSRFWVQACGEVTEKLKGMIVASESFSEALSVSLELSGAYDDSLTPSVEADLSAAIAAGVTARWMRLSFPDKASEWEAQSAHLLHRAFAKLCHRKKPTRTPEL